MNKWHKNSYLASPSEGENLESVFKNPPREFRPLPWLCYTGNICTGNIKNAINKLLSQGIDSFIIFPIYGLEIPYLSEEWFATVETTLEFAAAKSMKVWIYDDYNWPSGGCAGQLLKQNIDCNINHFVPLWTDLIDIAENIIIDISGKIHEVFVLENTDKYSRLDAGELDIRLSGHNSQSTVKWKNNRKRKVRLLFIINRSLHYDTVPNRGAPWLKNLNVKGYPDFTRTDSSRLFIELIYDNYYKRFEKHFGSTIAGFFTDEPQIKGVHINQELTEKFHEIYKYRLEDNIVALFVPSGNSYHKIRADYWRLCGKLLGEHLKRLKDWCEDRSVALTGHFMGEESPSLEVAYQGDSWPCRKQMSIPGLDILGCQTNYENSPARKIIERAKVYEPSGLILTAKVAVASAKYNGSNRVLAEVFGCMPYWVAPVDLSQQVQWLSAMGCNLVNDNLFSLSISGFRKRCLGGRHFTTPWSGFYHKISELVAKCSFMASLPLNARIGLLYPVLTAQIMRCAENSGIVYQTDSSDNKSLAYTDYCTQQTAEALCRSHLDWDILFEEVIENAVIEENILLVPNAKFKILVIPASQVLLDKVVSKLEEFAQAGGIIIFIGQIPLLDMGGNTVERIRMILSRENVHLIPFEPHESWLQLKNELAALIQSNSGYQYRILGDGADNILAAYRSTETRKILHLVNMSSRPLDVTVEIPSDEKFVLLHPDEGNCFWIDQAWDPRKQRTNIKLSFAPWEGYFLVNEISGCIDELPVLRRNFETVWKRSRFYHDRQFQLWRKKAFSSIWKTGRNQLNLCALLPYIKPDPDNIGMEKQWYAGNVDDSWMEADNGKYPYSQDPEKSRYLWGKAVFLIDVIPPKLKIVFDSSVVESAYLNGKKLDNSAKLCLWDRENIAYDLFPVSRKGKNILAYRFKVSEYFHKDIMLPHFCPNMIDPVVLQGDFDMDISYENETKIISSRNCLQTGNWKVQGLKNYAGSISYRQEMVWNCGTVKEAWLDLGKVCHVAEIKINDQSVGVKCWPPYLFRIDRFLAPGINTFEITVTNSFDNLLGHIYWSLGEICGEPEAGLLGPVTIHYIK